MKDKEGDNHRRNEEEEMEEQRSRRHENGVGASVTAPVTTKTLEELKESVETGICSLKNLKVVHSGPESMEEMLNHLFEQPWIPLDLEVQGENLASGSGDPELKVKALMEGYLIIGEEKQHLKKWKRGNDGENMEGAFSSDEDLIQCLADGGVLSPPSALSSLSPLDVCTNGSGVDTEEEGGSGSSNGSGRIGQSPKEQVDQLPIDLRDVEVQPVLPDESDSNGFHDLIIAEEMEIESEQAIEDLPSSGSGSSSSSSRFDPSANGSALEDPSVFVRGGSGSGTTNHNQPRSSVIVDPHNLLLFSEPPPSFGPVEEWSPVVVPSHSVDDSDDEGSYYSIYDKELSDAEDEELINNLVSSKSDSGSSDNEVQCSSAVKPANRTGDKDKKKTEKPNQKSRSLKTEDKADQVPVPTKCKSEISSVSSSSVSTSASGNSKHRMEEKAKEEENNNNQESNIEIDGNVIITHPKKREAYRHVDDSSSSSSASFIVTKRRKVKPCINHDHEKKLESKPSYSASKGDDRNEDSDDSIPLAHRMLKSNNKNNRTEIIRDKDKMKKTNDIDKKDKELLKRRVKDSSSSSSITSSSSSGEDTDEEKIEEEEDRMEPSGRKISSDCPSVTRGGAGESPMPLSQKLLANLKSENPDFDLIKKWMHETKADRYKFLDDNDYDLTKGLKKFPALKDHNITKWEFGELRPLPEYNSKGGRIRLLEEGLEQLYETIKEKEKKVRPGLVRHGIWERAIAALRNRGSYMAEDKQKVMKMLCICFFVVENSAPQYLFKVFDKSHALEEYMPDVVTPTLVMHDGEVESEDAKNMWIYADGLRRFKVPNVYEGVLCIYALHYIFNIMYNTKLKQLFEKFDELAGLKATTTAAVKAAPKKKPKPKQFCKD